MIKNSPFVFLSLLLASVSLSANEAARTLILTSGGTIEFGNAVPGKLTISGEKAFPVLLDRGGSVIAAGSVGGRGRVLAFSHGSFLMPGTFQRQESVQALLWNSLRWAGRDSNPRVGLHPALKGLKDSLEEAGFDAVVSPPEDIEELGVAAYCLIGHDRISEEGIEELSAFVEKGGGLLTATTPWAFKNRFQPFSELPANQLLAASGLQFLPSGYADQGSLEIGSGANDPKISPQSALRAVDRLLSERDSLTPSTIEALLPSMRMGKFLLGSARETFLNRLRELNESVGPLVPSKKNAVVPGADPLVDTIIELETHFNETAPAGLIYAIPAAADYPGAVPREAERVTHSLTIDGIYRGWLEGRNAAGWNAKEMRPTGIYAPPGEVVTVSVPAALAGKGFEIVIGSYGGSLKNRSEWHRYPDWQISRPVSESVTRISSGLGGLVTIRIPRNADHEEIEVTIEGGVRAPLYEHGKTDLGKWVSEIRRYPAPWAELASRRMIVAIPSEFIRDLENPDRVMELWNDIMEMAAELAQIDRNEYRAERIVFDRQTSAGFMHSGYPVAAHLGQSAEVAVDAEKLEEGNWGFFHEYGHNHQHNLWALPGTVETTCNLWSVYLFEEYVGKNRDQTHGSIRPLNRKQRVNAYFTKPTTFEKDWKVWTALETYLMIQEEFGWEPFQKVFREYNQLTPDERPRGQQAINDQWVIRLSRACGMNLQPFWKTWGLPMTNRVGKELEDLPVWEDHPVARWADPTK